MKISGVENDTGGAVVHLSQQEQHTIIEALVEQRERQENAMGQTEQLLRRMTGSITAYMDTVGQRPLRMSDYDKAVLAIRDGELTAFKDLWLKAEDRADELIVEAAGRPGMVGRQITAFVLLADERQFSQEVYRAVCQKAIDINDPVKVKFLLEQAADHVKNLSPSFHGEMACHAYLEHRHIAKEIIKQCSDEQIAAAPPRLLEQFAGDGDFDTMSTLVEKGISGGPSSWQTLHMLTYEGRNSWMAERLLQQRMWVETGDYGALDACVKNGAVGVAKLLLDGGMDFECYLQIYPDSGSEETIRALEEHWQTIQAQTQELNSAPTMGGMDFG